MSKIRRHYVFSGDVQGVGFRYTASHAARHLGVTGWVRNCYDGTVEMEAEGTEADLEALFETLNDRSYARICDIEAEDIPLQNDDFFDVIH